MTDNINTKELYYVECPHCLICGMRVSYDEIKTNKSVTCVVCGTKIDLSSAKLTKVHDTGYKNHEAILDSEDFWV